MEQFKLQGSQLFHSEWGITWKFNLDGAPRWGEFWERLVGIVNCLKKLIGNERLLFTKLSTDLFEIENVLNNQPLCFMYDDNVSEVLTPNSLLYGRKLEFVKKHVDEGYFEVAEGNKFVAEKKLQCKRFVKVFG